MNKWLAFVFAVMILLVIHEGSHALVAAIYGEFESFHIRPLGLEVVFRTPVGERAGIQWAFISGASNVVTLLIGYSLLMLRRRCNRIKDGLFRASAYYLTLISLLLDAFNLSIGPFIYGGDVNGIAVGLGISRYWIQGIFFLVMLANHELVARELLPAYNVQTSHPLLKPWIPFR
mgnify:CR=1 FL=1